MSQKLQVVQCFACQTFQTQIATKANKWVCKVCGEKQSLKKVFGQGNGRDCRTHCQRLNELRKERDTRNYCDSLDTTESILQLPENKSMSTYNSGNSKWTKYLSQSSTSDDDDFELSQASTSSMKPPPAKKYKEESEKPVSCEFTKSRSQFDEFSYDMNAFGRSLPLSHNTNRASCGNGARFNRTAPGVDTVQPSGINESDKGNGIFSANFNLMLEDMVEPELESWEYKNSHFSEQKKSLAQEPVPSTSGLTNVNTDVSNDDDDDGDIRHSEKSVFLQHPQQEKTLSPEAVLKKSISLFENIDNYTIAEITDLCSL